jgi:hypothetical protein
MHSIPLIVGPQENGSQEVSLALVHGEGVEIVKKLTDWSLGSPKAQGNREEHQSQTKKFLSSISYIEVNEIGTIKH